MFFINSIIDLALLINEYVDKEMNDESKLQKQLFENRLKYEMDEITEEEYKQTEEYLVKRLKHVQEQKMKAEIDRDE